MLSLCDESLCACVYFRGNLQSYNREKCETELGENHLSEIKFLLSPISISNLKKNVWITFYFFSLSTKQMSFLIPTTE